MSIQVTANMDGSYKISCGGESVIIGAPAALPPTVHERRTPESNTGGVRAFVMMHGGGLDDANWETLRTRALDLGSLDRLEHGDEGNQTVAIPNSSCLEFATPLEPGQTIDVTTLVDRVEALGVSESTPVFLSLSSKTRTS